MYFIKKENISKEGHESDLEQMLEETQRQWMNKGLETLGHSHSTHFQVYVWFHVILGTDRFSILSVIFSLKPQNNIKTTVQHEFW